jgi:AcrR family transcriptional regulator
VVTRKALSQYRERMTGPEAQQAPADVLPHGMPAHPHQARAEILDDLTATGHASPRTPLEDSDRAGEWRRLARAAGRSIGRPIRTYAGPDGPAAVLHDWPATDAERTTQARTLRATVEAVSLNEGPRRRGPGRPRKDSGPGARERIMTAAASSFAARGFRASGVDAIAEEAGVAKASFYKYFGSRSDLEVAHLELEHQDAADDLAQREEAHPVAADALVDFVDAAALRLAASPAANVFVLATVEYREENHPARIAAHAHVQWRHRQLTRLFTSASHPTPNAAATDLAAALDGAELLAYVTDRDTAAGSARRTLARLLSEVPADS